MYFFVYSEASAATNATSSTYVALTYSKYRETRSIYIGIVSLFSFDVSVCFAGHIKILQFTFVRCSCRLWWWKQKVLGFQRARLCLGFTRFTVYEFGIYLCFVLWTTTSACARVAFCINTLVLRVKYMGAYMGTLNCKLDGTSGLKIYNKLAPCTLFECWIYKEIIFGIDLSSEKYWSFASCNEIVSQSALASLEFRCLNWKYPYGIDTMVD